MQVCYCDYHTPVRRNETTRSDFLQTVSITKPQACQLGVTLKASSSANTNSNDQLSYQVLPILIIIRDGSVK